MKQYPNCDLGIRYYVTYLRSMIWPARSILSSACAKNRLFAQSTHSDWSNTKQLTHSSFTVTLESAVTLYKVENAFVVLSREKRKNDDSLLDWLTKEWEKICKTV